MTTLTSSLSDPIDIAKRCGPAHHRGCKELITPLGRALELPRDHDCNNALRAIAKILTEQHHAITELTGRLNVVLVDFEQMNQRIACLEQSIPAALKALKNDTDELERRLMKLKTFWKSEISEIETNCDKALMELEREASEARVSVDHLKLELEKAVQHQEKTQTTNHGEVLHRITSVEKSIVAQAEENSIWKIRTEGAWKMDVEGWLAEKQKLEAEIAAKLERQELKSLRSFEHHTARVTNLEAFTYSVYHSMEELKSLTEQNDS